jgi:hypothetical protein
MPSLGSRELIAAGRHDIALIPLAHYAKHVRTPRLAGNKTPRLPAPSTYRQQLFARDTDRTGQHRSRHGRRRKVSDVRVCLMTRSCRAIRRSAQIGRRYVNGPVQYSCKNKR